MKNLIILTGIAFGIFINSCSSSKPLAKNNKQPSKSLTVQQQSFPDGWADITDKSKIPALKLWLVNRDYSATMALQELQSDDSTRKVLSQDDICTAARISLQLKVGEYITERRVTRTPEKINGSACSYVYEEKGLLRRVVVYQNGKGFYELELLQEQSYANFESLTNDQLSVMKMLVMKK